MNDDDAPLVIAIASDRFLIGDAVSAALSGNRLVIVRVSWPDDCEDRGAGWPPGSEPPEFGLMLCDLSPSSVAAARWVVARYPTRWLLLTDAPRGPLWGAVLEAGVAGVLPSNTTIAEVLDVIATAHEGDVLTDHLRERVDLVMAWRRAEAERIDVQARMNTLSQREREVLQLIHHGFTVREIAQRHDVAPSTVRSQVRSVLRKLGVSSQLAASALFEKWGGG